MNKIVTTSILIAGLLMSAACTGNDALKILEITVDAATVALPIVAASSGIPPELTGQLESYLQNVNVAIGQASTILSGPGTPGEKRAQVIAAFSSIALPLLPPGIPSAVASAVKAVADDVARFLATVSIPTSPSKLAKLDRGAVDPATKARLDVIKAKVDSNLKDIAAKKVRPPRGR